MSEDGIKLALKLARPMLDNAPQLEGSCFVAASRQMLRIRDMARRAGKTDAKALITGESGVGKDVVAREIHAASPRARRAFIAVNCAGLPENLLESELFGHMRGSFTGAYRDRPGKLQEADGGTLFLDEVGEMSLRMQAMLLRFLENGEIQVVGETRPRTVDVRVITATNRNLAERVASGLFREDLLYRLRVIHITVPPLRERVDDIPALVAHTLSKSRRRMTFTNAAMRLLTRYRWPGNVRELQNVVEQATWLANGSEIDVSDLPENIRSAASGLVVVHERRRQIADQLFESLVQGNCTFWEHVHPLFLSRDLTRHDIRELVSRGLAATKGNYRAVMKLFGMSQSDYYRFHNFLTAHDSKVDFRKFRGGATAVATARPPKLPKVS
jgi:DNA-binding NtrC family response regulator